jgi:hypothetical protein
MKKTKSQKRSGARPSKLDNKAKHDMLLKLIDGYNRSSQTPFPEVGEFVDPETGMSMFIWAKAPIKNR